MKDKPEGVQNLESVVREWRVTSGQRLETERQTLAAHRSLPVIRHCHEQAES